MIIGVNCIRKMEALNIYVLLFTPQGLRAHPIHSQQTMIISNVSEKGREQGMQQCLKRRRMQEISDCVKRVKKRKVMDGLRICGVTDTLPCNLDGSKSHGLLPISCIFLNLLSALCHELMYFTCIYYTIECG